ncbi:MAG TPA: hypothetical protein VF614_03815 [Chthoniobacteraceae bacterium]
MKTLTCDREEITGSRVGFYLCRGIETAQRLNSVSRFLLAALFGRANYLGAMHAGTGNSAT